MERNRSGHKALATAGQGRKLRVAVYCRTAANSEDSLNCRAAQVACYAQKIKENPEWELAGIFADEGLAGAATKNRREGQYS